MKERDANITVEWDQANQDVVYHFRFTLNGEEFGGYFRLTVLEVRNMMGGVKEIRRIVCDHIGRCVAERMEATIPESVFDPPALKEGRWHS